ncbi:serine/threonine-protein kinase PBL36-like [Lycium ferocissimum]|uniref:serine/threonine-protein kinase PBL36-like n=1 Tax=Lycium ferocissimum TaxID=112874 RepID=UPI0028152D60|nr:serine/threonine-protein kinase PBL36-like [Lycium ferocissimum]
MDKTRPRGEQYLVAWAKLYLADRRNFCRIIDPRLEGQFSKNGALRCTDIVSRCLRKNAKYRPLMSEVVEMLTSLPLIREIASTPNMQIGVNSNGQNRTNMQAGVILAKDKHAAGSLPSPSGSYASSSHYTLTCNRNIVNRNIT